MAMDTYELARAFHEANLLDAERRRRARLVARHEPSFGKRLTARLGDLLIVFGSHLKAKEAASPDSTFSVLDLDAAK